MVTLCSNEMELRSGYTSGVHQKMSCMTLMKGVYSAESMHAHATASNWSHAHRGKD